MNTLDNGLIDRMRVEAINRAKARNQPANANENIELANEFRNIINNPIFPLGKQEDDFRWSYEAPFEAHNQASELNSLLS